MHRHLLSPFILSVFACERRKYRLLFIKIIYKMKLRSRLNNFPYLSLSLSLSDFSIISILVWSMNSTCTIVRNLLINIWDLRRRREIFLPLRKTNSTKLNTQSNVRIINPFASANIEVSIGSNFVSPLFKKTPEPAQLLNTSNSHASINQA